MKRFLAALIGALAFHAQAVIPENGWWWNSATSGSGFNLEIQNNSLFFAAFVYDSSGTPIWITAGGPMTSDRDFSAQLVAYTSGSCVGCPYRAPQAVNAGSLTLHFTSSQTATLTINGYTQSVERFDFWLNKVAPDAMLGEWSMIIGESSVPVYFGERVQFVGKTSDSSGPYLAGRRLGSPSNAAVVRYDSSRGVFYSLLDSSSQFYRYSEWTQTGYNRIEGTTWVYDKTASGPSGSGLFFQAYRTASASFVTTGVGPASSKRVEADDAIQVAKDNSEALAAAREGPEPFAADPARRGRLADLQSRLKQ